MQVRARTAEFPFLLPDATRADSRKDAARPGVGSDELRDLIRAIDLGIAARGFYALYEGRFGGVSHVTESEKMILAPGAMEHFAQEHGWFAEVRERVVFFWSKERASFEQFA